MFPNRFNILRRLFISGALLVISIFMVWKGASFTSAKANSDGVLTPRVYLPLTLKTDIDLTVAKVKIIQATTASEEFAINIAGRQALARVFVDTSTGKNISGVTARMCAGVEGAPNPSCILADNGPITVPSKENDLSRTLNFTLPIGWLQPGYSYHVDLDPQGLIHESNRTNNRYPATGRQSFNFVSAPDLRSVIVPVAYQPFNTSQVYLPELDNLDYLTFLPIKILPIPAFTYQTHATYFYQPTEIRYNLNNPFGDGWSRLLEEITAVHHMEDPAGSQHYYGLVNSYDAHGCSSSCITGVGYFGGTGGYFTAVGWSGSGEASPLASETMVHELGHNFKRKHVQCSFEPNPDPTYPYPGGKIGRWGLDVATATLYDPNITYDFMSYCAPSWTSDYTFWNIYQYRQSAALGVATSPLPEDALYISGIISPDGQITLRPVYRQVVELPDLLAGPYLLEMLGREGEVLATHSFTTLDVADAPGFRLFGFFVPAIDGFSGLRLRMGERILVERTNYDPMDKAAFEIGALSLEGDQDQPSLRWPAVSNPSADVVYRLRYSADAGLTWQVISLDWGKTEFRIPTHSGIDLSRGLIEVQASDGIHTITRVFNLGRINSP